MHYLLLKPSVFVLKIKNKDSSQNTTIRAKAGRLESYNSYQIIPFKDKVLSQDLVTLFVVEYPVCFFKSHTCHYIKTLGF